MFNTRRICKRAIICEMGQIYFHPSIDTLHKLGTQFVMNVNNAARISSK